MSGFAARSRRSTLPARTGHPTRSTWVPCFAALALGLLAPVAPATGQAPQGADPSRRLAAVRMSSGEPRIDGVLDDRAWADAPVARDFTQFRPEPGAPASQRTEARVLLGADALVVGIRAYDSAPDSIVSELTRRDEDHHSDGVGVLVESYLDRRSAFQFTVNPRGVKTDLRRFDDTSEDLRWDPVWEVATSVDGEGWAAELRIPLSQPRFGGAPVQTWGIQFHRDIARLDEASVWAPLRPEDGAMVSRFGDLYGLVGVERPVRLEMLPYGMSRVREGVVPGDPEARESDLAGGADLKYALARNFTLDVTVNPDFGQVEADPARVNLTAFESFCPERRPFFQEASDLSDFQLSLADGEDDLETLFYSRRVGRQPQGYTPGDERFASPSEQTTILGAAKISGRTASGWSVGLLSAATARETARTAADQPGAAGALVEPRAEYSVLRIVRDLRRGRSAVELIGTGVVRDGGDAEALGLPSASLAASVDFRHRFGSDRYQLWGWAVASRVQGSKEAVARVQTSPVHLFQRPDASHLEWDPTRTAMDGFAATVRLHRIAIVYAEVGYERSQPQGPFRSWVLYSTHWGVDTNGSERVERGGNLRGDFLLRGRWGGWGGAEYNLEGLTTWLLRGGPAFRREGEVMGWGGVFSDDRRRLGGGVEAEWSHRPESGSWAWQLSPSLAWRPTPVATLRVGPFVADGMEGRQWIGAVGDGPTTYVLGRLRQRTLGASLRADLAFSPTLSLQLYAQPFVSASAYRGFKRVADPKAGRYADRFAALEVSRDEGGALLADLDGNGVPEPHDNPDFNFRRLRANTVLRWEYRPGSTLYLVWSQGREDVREDGRFRPGRDLGGLFNARADDALMVKVTYWWTP